jgi:hypothetical protein
MGEHALSRTKHRLGLATLASDAVTRRQVSA